jgi:hypothetical protein
MKKVMVIPYDQYEVLKNQKSVQNNESIMATKDPEIFNDPVKEKIMRIEMELKDLLNANMNIEQKRIKYVQLFDQLQNFLQLLKSSSENTRAPSSESEIEGEDNLEKWLKITLPNTLKTKGVSLYQFLKTQQGLTWDKNNGEISVNNNKLRGTNIVDLVVDLVRSHKGPPVTGWKPILIQLKQNNIPLSLINNKDRIKDLMSQASGSLAAPATPVSAISANLHSTPISSSAPFAAIVSSGRKKTKRLRGNVPYTTTGVFQRRSQRWTSF